jgi:hypothetical protein
MEDNTMQHKNVLILILTLLSVWFYTTAQAASDARLYLTVSHDESSPQSKTISVKVENAPLIYGVDIRLSFDPTMLEVVRMEELYFERKRLDLAREVRQSKG